MCGRCNAARLAKKGHKCGAVCDKRPESKGFSRLYGSAS